MVCGLWFVVVVCGLWFVVCGFDFLFAFFFECFIVLTRT